MREIHNDDIRNYYSICTLDGSYSDAICIINMAVNPAHLA